MRFSSILALVGLTSSTTVTLPTISYNSTAFDTIGREIKAWEKRDVAAFKNNMNQTSHDVANALSQYIAESESDFGENYKPLADSLSDFLKTMDTANNFCNTTKAAECVRKNMLGEFPYCKRVSVPYSETNRYYGSTRCMYRQEQFTDCVKTDARCVLNPSQLDAAS